MATSRESLGLSWLHLTIIQALDAVIAAGLSTFALKIWHSDDLIEKCQFVGQDVVAPAQLAEATNTI
jgi:hypothetical protein